MLKFLVRVFMRKRLGAAFSLCTVCALGLVTLMNHGKEGSTAGRPLTFGRGYVYRSYTDHGALGGNLLSRTIPSKSSFEEFNVSGYDTNQTNRGQSVSQNRVALNLKPRVVTLSNVTEPSVLARTQHIKARCGSIRGQVSPRISSQFLISKSRQALYCPITKAGSTFLRRLMVTMEKYPDHPSPLLLTIRSREHKKAQTLAFLKGKPEAKQIFYKEAFKFVFTRDPYARLFSTFVDKLYSPNDYYWKHWGKQVIRTFSLDPNKHPCGRGSTFSQFFQTVVSSLHTRDFHFSVMVKACDICKTNYDVIANMEHAVPDIDFVSEKLHISSDYQHDPEYRLQTFKDVIDDSSYDALHTWKSALNECIQRYDVGRIVWRKLQIRGIIDAGIDFPFSEKDMESIVWDQFREKCYRAAEKSISNIKQLSKQKYLAMVAAFATVSENDLKLFQQIYAEDFRVLNYDLWPNMLQEAQEAKDDNAYSTIFDWSKPWRL